MNQHYFDVPFAFAGDVTVIPDPLQVGGTVSFTEGWNFNYQRNLSTDPAALPIDRATTNWLFLQITKALQAIQQTSVPEFITAAQNGGTAFAYGLGSEVLWSASGNAPFGKYVTLTAANTNTPSVSDPQGLTTGWQLVVDAISTAAQAAAGTDDASIMTPLKVAQQTALRALLAGNSSQVFNVAPATASTHAVQLAQLQASSSVIGASRNAFARTTATGSTFPWSADEIVVGTALGGLMTKLTNVSKTLNVSSVGAGGMDIGSAPASGWLAVYLMYNPNASLSSTNPCLVGSNATSALAAEFYNGANAPSGYTQSALVAVIPTTAASTLWPIQVTGRRHAWGGVSVVNTSVVPGGFTNASLAAAVPKNARFFGGSANIAVNAGSFNLQFSIGSDSTGANPKTYLTNVTWANGQGFGSTFDNVPITIQQTMAYTFSGGAGSTPTFTCAANLYEI